MKIFCYLQFLFERKYTENTIEYNIFILMNSPDYTIMQKKTYIILVVIFLLISQVWVVWAITRTVFYRDLINTEAAWIASLQLPTWAIVTGNPDLDWQTHIVPYFSNIAAMSLLDADSAKYKSVVKKYINWYFDHLNMPDYTWLYWSIYDYKYNINTRKETLDWTWRYDSVDSYSATFLSLLRKYHEKTNDTRFLKNKYYLVSAIVWSIPQLQDPTTWLTYAHDAYHISYLMDNAEVYRWLLDAAYLFRNIYTDASSHLYFRIMASNIKQSIAKYLWSDTKQAYFPYFGATTIDTTLWYPDGQAQVFPLLNNLVPTSVGCRQYDRFSSTFPDWIDSKHDDTRFPGAFMAIAAYRCGDYSNMDRFLVNSDTYFARIWHPWVWNISEAAWSIVAANACIRNTKCINK